jgi:hypothetical protein
VHTARFSRRCHASSTRRRTTTVHMLPTTPIDGDVKSCAVWRTTESGSVPPTEVKPTTMMSSTAGHIPLPLGFRLVPARSYLLRIDSVFNSYQPRDRPHGSFQPYGTPLLNYDCARRGLEGWRRAVRPQEHRPEQWRPSPTDIVQRVLLAADPPFSLVILYSHKLISRSNAFDVHCCLIICLLTNT